MKPAPPSLLVSAMVTLSSAILLLFVYAAFARGNLWVLVVAMLGMFVVSALATFNTGASPFSVAMALAFPALLLTVLLAMSQYNTEGSLAALGMLVLPSAVFGIGWVSGHAGRYRRAKLEVSRDEATR